MSIRVKNLHKVYGEQKAVNDISFSVNKGEIVGFLGPNGAGKSTTMKILTGYLKPTSGEAMVCDLNVASHPLAIKKKIGYLPESNPLYYDMYVREYLGFIAGVHGLANKKTAVSHAIEMVGLGPEQQKKIGQLSKGYKQRVGLAAALIYDPEVLILDEPTTGLDPNQIVEIREVIRRQGENKTVLFSSHILQEVEAVCNRVIIINKGELVADDTVASLQAGKGNMQRIQVEFAHNVQPGLFIPTFEPAQVQMLSGTKYRFSANNPELLRRQLRELAMQHDLDIIAMQSESQSLETVFKELTGKNEQ
ncbi:gliding motility-associated ABC transporter ATP-binding subunit GldA [Agriterribacter sp.]|uniref:gliding motility-associated ABC transporter ATP-binding subunit GldA n=1 Tax=Agriterribacter sp. TaxID=2821509 RepID=UPI002BB57A15|nr:gliding motility-associated ABC transporter ATP-binding subunit GldA [Agriterribacter sp.]HTN07120.1 gliding motility-associated ABC transporter ATP-binding subunit GldA [Agriterribacter sp.]